MLRFVMLLWIVNSFFSCTQANKGESQTDQPSSLSAPQAHASRVADEVIHESGIETVYADADGNGVADRIERCGSAAVCIYLRDNAGQESPPHTYKNPGWGIVSIERVENINNLPGSEVIVKASKIDGDFECVCIIDARNRSIDVYTDPSWFSVTIDSLSDTDGNSGLEIILSVTNKQGEFHCICVIHPNNGAHTTYSDAKWKTVTILSQEDTDGFPGQELILDVRDGQNGLVCLCVVHDRNSTTTAYQDGAWGSSSWINTVVDTDGHPGAEIILIFQEPTPAKVSIIHDRTKELNIYRFSSEVIVETVSNMDAQPGSEICVRVSTSHEHYVIRDRTKEQEVIEHCA